MKITEVRAYAHTLPRVGNYTMSTSSVGDPDSTILEIVTDSGLTGWGEACPAGPSYQPANSFTIRAALELIGPSLIGIDPRQIGLVRRSVDRAVNGSPEAKAMVDIACWDLTGKAYGARICDLLGGPLADTVPTYHVVGIGSAHEAAASAHDLQSQGHTKLQLKAGGRHIDEDIDSIRAVTNVIRPHVDLFVDVNRGWTVEEVIQVSNACADLRFSIEQPCNTYVECARAKPHLRHPLLLDESAVDLMTISAAISNGVANGFGMKLTRIGGISGMRAVRDLCEATHTPTSFDDSWGGDIIAAACVHIGSTMTERLSRGVWIADPYIDGHYDADNGPRIEHGRIAVPREPGLGLSIPDDFFGAPIASY
jgi:L-alanine-DL-glutamate epimerase-like enolase superfamily enzyme